MAEPPPQPFGKLLGDARAARGLTLQEVSASTKIPVSKLQAIEHDEIGSLPGGVFTRGFVRAYAEAVGLDPQEVLAQFESRFPAESSVATLHATHAGRANERLAKRQRRARGLIWLALPAAPLVLWLLAAGVPDEEEAAAPVETVAGELELGSAPGSGSESAPAAPAIPPPAASGARTDPPAAPADAEALVMEIGPTADCWVLASADGATVISRVLRAGDREAVVAREAIELRIGDAGAFAFTINQRPGRSLGAPGEVVDLRVTRSNYLSFVAE